MKQFGESGEQSERTEKSMSNKSSDADRKTVM